MPADLNPAPGPVPFLDLTRQYAAIREEVARALAPVMGAQRFVLGEQGQLLEQEIARLCGVEAAAGVASGTDALLLAFRALGLGPGDEVITTPFSFFATAGAIVNAGARPVFADIDPVSFNLDPEAAAAAVGPNSRALCPVHLYGRMAPMEALLNLGRRHDLPLVEDAAQAIGACQGTLRAGGVGDLAALSFYPTKNLGGFGDGGMVTGRSQGLVEKVRLLRHHGQTGAYQHEHVGTNSRLDEIQAAVLRVKLGHLERWTDRRRENARTLTGALVASGLAVRDGGPLDGADLSLPREPEGERHVYNSYTLRARDRDGLKAALDRQGIGCGIYYPLPLHLQTCFADLGGRAGQYPRAEEASREVLSLPVFPELTGSELERIAEAVRCFYRGSC